MKKYWQQNSKNLPEEFWASAELIKNADLNIRIYVDIDGVIGDFVLHAQRHGKFDAHGKTLWDKLDEEWWVSMPPLEGAVEFYEEVSKFAPTSFLTSPILNSSSHAGKARWIEKIFDKYKLGELIIFPGWQKWTLAKPTYILIDDSPGNVNDWIEAGGVAFLFEGDFEKTMADVKEAIEKLKSTRNIDHDYNNQPEIK